MSTQFHNVDIVTLADSIGAYTFGEYIDDVRLICVDGNFDILDTLGDSEGYTVVQNNELKFEFAKNLRKTVMNFKGTTGHKIRILSKRTQ